MSYNLYRGNSGRVERVDEQPGRQQGARQGQPSPGVRPQQAQPRPGSGPPAQRPRPISAPGPGQRRPPGPLSGLGGELGKLLRKLSSPETETEDLLLMMIMYLLYKESGDQDYLIMIAGLLLL